MGNGETAKPAPPIPKDVDLRSFPYMPLNINQLQNSVTWAKAVASPWASRACINLWARSWYQVPAGSLPNDDDLLERWADVPHGEWEGVRELALRGFVECSDGLLYHLELCKIALQSWGMKRRKGAAGAEARWGDTDLDSPATRHDRLRAARSLGKHTSEEWLALLSVFDHQCVFCGTGGKLSKLHVVPIHKGGSDSIDNIQPACPSCSRAYPSVDVHRPGQTLNFRAQTFSTRGQLSVMIGKNVCNV